MLKKIGVIAIWIHAWLQSGGLCLVPAPQHSPFPFQMPVCKHPVCSRLDAALHPAATCMDTHRFFQHASLEQLYAVHALSPTPAHSQMAEENKRMAPNRKIQAAHRSILLRFPVVWVGISGGEIVSPSLSFCQLVDVFNGHSLVGLSCLFGHVGEVQ